MNGGARWPLLGSALIGAVWLLALVRRRTRQGAPLEAEVRIRRPHWVQTILHSSIFAYWGFYVDVVYPQVPLILAQVVFAYALDLLVAWTRGRRWVIGMGPIPIVGSTNLFLWFHQDVFALQLGMVAAAFLSREFLRWTREGQRTHIFNPSGFGLTVASFLVIATGTTDWTWGSTIATTLIQAPGLLEWIFICGVIVQVLFGVCLVTMMAVLTVYGGGYLIFWLTGAWHFENVHIPVAVFLGMHLLITDPVTSPRSNAGKALFGVLYGVAVFPLYTGLLALGTPSFYDKLLQVPALNLMAPLLDRVTRRLNFKVWTWSPPRTNLIHVAIWCVAFFAMRGDLKNHPGQKVEYWDARCTPDDTRSCKQLVKLYEGLCREKEAGDACVLLADLFMQGDRVPADEQRAVYFYERGCERQVSRACTMLAMAHAQGRGGLTVSPANAGRARAQACRLGDAAACVKRASQLVDGRGIPANPAAAARLLADACDAGLGQPCAILGFMLQQGQGIPADSAEARRRYGRACELGFKLACSQRDALPR